MTGGPPGLVPVAPCACGEPPRGGASYCVGCGVSYRARHGRWPITVAGSVVAWVAAAALLGAVWSQPEAPLWASSRAPVPAGPDRTGVSDVRAPGPPTIGGTTGTLGPRLVPASVSASSFTHRRHERHPPEDAFDGVQRTAWNDGVDGSGAGQWIEAHMEATRRFRRVRFSTGFDHVSSHYGDLFYANAHMSVARIEVDGRAVARVQVEFDRRQAVVDLDATGTSLRIVAESVYAGQRWQDVCVSEVEIEGE